MGVMTTWGALEPRRECGDVRYVIYSLRENLIIAAVRGIVTYIV